jgi:hypothetical protein
MTVADPLAATRADATPDERRMGAEARAHLAARVGRPPRVPMKRVVTVCALVMLGQAGLLLVLDQSWNDALLPGFLILIGTFGIVFCASAVTVAGFVAGAGAAGLVATEGVGLPVLLAGAAVFALGTGIAPGWARVEAWQAVRSAPLTAEEEAAIAQRPLTPSGRRLWTPGIRLSNYWRTDRVLAAFLVLAFPPSVTWAALEFVTWTANR